MLQITDIERLAGELGKWQTWAVLTAVAVAGVLGGLARKLTAEPTDTATGKADTVVGAITALAMLMVVPVQQLVSLLGVSIVSGFAGKSILDALRARAEALAAKEQAKEAKDAAAEADAKRKEAVQKGLTAVKKAQEVIAHSDGLTNDLKVTLGPDVFTKLPKTSRFFIKEEGDLSGPTSLTATAATDLNSLEHDLQQLM